MVGDLLADGVPIDGVGFQLHVSETFSEKEIAGVADNLATLGAMGLEVHFTEVDVSCGSWPGYACPEWGEEQQEQQAAVYSGLLEACLGAPGVCASFETWGFTDKYSKAALPFTVNQCPHSCKPIPILHGLLTVALLHCCTHCSVFLLVRAAWLTSVYGQNEHPLPFDENYAKKPAYSALLSTFLNGQQHGQQAPSEERREEDGRRRNCHYTKGCQ